VRAQYGRFFPFLASVCYDDISLKFSLSLTYSQDKLNPEKGYKLRKALFFCCLYQVLLQVMSMMEAGEAK